MSNAAWSTAAFATLKPRPRLSVSQWADSYRIIPQGTSPEPLQWRTSRAPYLREPMDAVSDPDVERVTCMMASQLGKTELLLNLIAYFADQDPAPILLVQPNEAAMGAFSKERIEPMFRETPALAGKLAEGARNKDNTIMLRQFPGGYLACAWAGSAASLASRPIRVVLADELDRWPDSIGRDGSPLAQAIQRTSNFHNRKIVTVSTPTIESVSEIERLYLDSDQRHYHVPCPHCGTAQILRWDHVIYKTDGAVDLDRIWYRCESGCRIEERDKPEMIAAGQWLADNPGHAIRGYQISALYSPWVRWRELASEWIKAQADRDKRGQQEFVNLRLGEPWVEGGAQIHAEHLEANRSDYGCEVPARVRWLTCGADVQANRIEAEVVGWGPGKESWGIAYAILPGDTSTREPWDALDRFLSRTFGGRRISRTFVDSGFRTDVVYDFCRERIHRNVYPIKGSNEVTHPLVNDKPTPQGQQRALLFFIGSHAGKDTLFDRLLLDSPGPGYCHWPAEGRGYDTEYFRGLCSERRKARIRGGRRHYEYVQTYARNEPLDCRIYATAAMDTCLLLDGWTLDEPVVPTPTPAVIPQAAPPMTQPPQQPQRRRWFNPGI